MCVCIHEKDRMLVRMKMYIKQYRYVQQHLLYSKWKKIFAYAITMGYICDECVVVKRSKRSSLEVD